MTVTSAVLNTEDISINTLQEVDGVVDSSANSFFVNSSAISISNGSVTTFISPEIINTYAIMVGDSIQSNVNINSSSISIAGGTTTNTYIDLYQATFAGVVEINESLSVNDVLLVNNDITIGDISGTYSFINATSFTGSANNADYLGGQLPAYYTNATNITTGTLPYAQIPANIINTTAAFTRTGITTFSANVVLGSSGLSSNGSFGTAGQILASNGTATYWATTGGGSGTVTSVATGNGMTGGPITTTGTVSVLANTGIVANATGVFVNSAYIATITSNSATYANSSVTNAFTVGTASYFVSNGNLGVGTSSPISKIHIQSGGSPRLLTIQSTDVDSSSGIGLTNDAREWAISVRADLSDALAIRDITTNEDRVTVTSSGNVGIGNSSPTNKLSVNGTTYLQANVTLNAALIANGGSGTAGQVLSSNGTATYWATASGGSSAVTTSDTAPGSPTDGTLWWNSSLGKMFIYYDDGTSSQWVESSPALAAPERSYDYAIAYALKSISF